MAVIAATSTIIYLNKDTNYIYSYKESVDTTQYVIPELCKWRILSVYCSANCQLSAHTITVLKHCWPDT